MLNLLRKKKVAKRIYYGLAIIIIPAFVIWGSASVLKQDKTLNEAGVIFGQKVSFDDFRDCLAAWKLQLKLQFGEKAQEVSSALFNPVQASWDRLILMHEAKQRKIKVNDAEVIATITRMPFLERNGRFDPPTYELFLQYDLGVPPRYFEEQVRQNIALAKVFEQVTSNVSATDDEVKKEYIQQNEQTRVKYVFFPLAADKDKITVTEDEIQAYYENHKEKFKVPPQINAAYAAIDLKEDASADQKASATDKMKTLWARAQKDGFQKAAQEAKLEVKETGFFGFEDPIPALGWMPQLSTLLFDLTESSLSKVIELKRGVYLFKIKEKKDAYVPDFNEAKAKAREALVNERSKSLSLQKCEDFLDKIKTSSLAFEEAARKTNLTVKETPLFSRESYIPELGMAQPLKEIAFNLSRDQTAQTAVELEQGFYAIKSMETPSLDEEKFKKEKEEFAKQLLEQKKNKAFNEFFEGLKKKANLISYVDEATFPK